MTPIKLGNDTWFLTGLNGRHMKMASSKQTPLLHLGEMKYYGTREKRAVAPIIKKSPIQS